MMNNDEVYGVKFLWVCGRLEFRQRPERAAGVP